MAKRMSNKERIARSAEEAAAKAKAKKKTTKKKTTKKVAKKTTKKKTTKKKTVGSSGRIKLVYKVFNASFKEVETFTNSQKSDADKFAATQTDKTGQQHFVNAVKVPMDE